MLRDDLNRDCTCSGSCGPERGRRLTRREFVKLTASSAAAVSGLSGWPVMAGPFEAKDFESLVPVDKKLSPAWVRSLYERGKPEIYSGQELKYIGLPVGGIACGQLYVGGDGTLWGWDIFNRPVATSRFNECDGIHYKDKPEPHSIVAQGFAIRVKAGDRVWKKGLDKSGFSDIQFRGEYPIATVTYRDPGLPVEVVLEAFSPFMPLQAKDSAIPATIMSFSVNNVGDQPVEITIAGWLENAVRRFTVKPEANHRVNQWQALGKHSVLSCSWLEQETEDRPTEQTIEPREDVVLEDFEGDFSKWIVEGNAFGQGPTSKDELHGYPLSNSEDTKLALSHRRDGGADSARADSRVGQLTSQPFKIDRQHITFLIAGGSHVDETCIQLLVEGEAKRDNLGNTTEVIQSVTGDNSGAMKTRYFDVSDYQGKRARLRIVDAHRGGWGHTAIDHIVLSDVRPEQSTAAGDFDHGSMGLMLLQGADRAQVNLDLTGRVSAETIFDELKAPSSQPTRPSNRKAEFVGGLAQTRELLPKEKTRFDFVINWFFPSAALENWQSDWIWPHITSIQTLKRHYANSYASAVDVAADVARRFKTLTATTRLWRDTWYDSTLPYWLLDRIMIPTDCLATQTCVWFDNGRFYGWEGTYCCGGTCAHVWHYAQAVGRLFPELERSVRRHVDFEPKVGQRTNGGIGMRGESGKIAVDGHCGRILGMYREHLMSSDDRFLRALWPQVKKAIDYLIHEDGNGDGILEGEQHNTLDAAWYGPSPWLSSLYIAAVKAGSEMAQRMGESEYAGRCAQIAERGGKTLPRRLSNGEYFVHHRDPDHPNANGSGNGCEAGQVQGQSWAHQVGMGRILPEEETRRALNALWKYNYTPDVAPFRKTFEGGRWYAMPGEGGLINCTFPQGDAENLKRGNIRHAAYFNECWTGYEYQVASHMIAEATPELVERGLAIVRTAHERHLPIRRNPYNEVECSDHYARAMSAYGVLIALCGFEYDGPAGYLAFAPRMTPEDFRAPFTVAEGWGTMTQERHAGAQTACVEIKWGKLDIRRVTLELPEDKAPGTVQAEHAGRRIQCRWKRSGQRITVTLSRATRIDAGQDLRIHISIDQ